MQKHFLVPITPKTVFNFTYSKSQNLHGNNLDNHGAEVWWRRVWEGSNIVSFQLHCALTKNEGLTNLNHHLQMGQMSNVRVLGECSVHTLQQTGSCSPVSQTLNRKIQCVLQTKHLFTIIIYLSIHLHTLHMSSNHTDIKWYCSYKKAPNFILNDARVPLFICLGSCCVWDMNIKSTFLFFTSSSWYQMTVAGNWLVIQAH